MIKLAIITPTYCAPYGHVKDGKYRVKLWQQTVRSLEESNTVGLAYVHLTRDGADWNENYRYLLGEACKVAPLCLIADSDAYFHPAWLRWLENAMYSYPDAAGWQLYNSPRLTDYTVRDLGIAHTLERRHASPHGLCFRTADYEAAAPGEWFETFIGKLASKHSMGFIVPRVSVIQHCGACGLNNVPGGSEDFDPNFALNDKCLTLP